jgi:hypothetical protein
MAVQLNIDYEALVQLVNQLPVDKQQALLVHLLERAKIRQLSKEEKIALLHASILSVPIKEEPSIRREDWYDEDGR